MIYKSGYGSDFGLISTAIKMSFNDPCISSNILWQLVMLYGTYLMTS